MIAALLVPCVIAQGAADAQVQAPSPAQIVSKMIGRYNAAQTLSGKIQLTSMIKGQGGSLVTKVQFELPSKLYIRQEKLYGDGRIWLVTSDGKRFSYEPPPGLPPGKTQVNRLIEPINLKDGKSLTVRDVYAASVASIGDRSPVLDIAIGRKEDLEYLRFQWATLRYEGVTRYGDEEVHAISGDWREYGTAPVTGQFRMLINEAGDLRQYVISEKVNLETAGTQRLDSVWDVQLQVNGAVDPALFKLVTR